MPDRPAPKRTDHTVVHRDGDIAGMRIGEVARRTGTTSALLRAWETRHGVLSPARTDGGQRLYSERDVRRVQLVRELVADGWSIAGAVARLRDSGEIAPETPASEDDDPPRLDGHDLGPRAGLLAPLVDVDPDAVRIAFQAARAMLRATSTIGIRDAIVTMVEELGGTTGPASTQADNVIPVDISFGEGPPLLPLAAPATVARMRLEALLPVLVEDALAMSHQLRLARRGVGQLV